MVHVAAAKLFGEKLILGCGFLPFLAWKKARLVVWVK